MVRNRQLCCGPTTAHTCQHVVVTGAKGLDQAQQSPPWPPSKGVRDFLAVDRDPDVTCGSLAWRGDLDQCVAIGHEISPIGDDANLRRGTPALL
jgi:hypothetical protein